jgi:hypothetical protein
MPMLGICKLPPPIPKAKRTMRSKFQSLERSTSLRDNSHKQGHSSSGLFSDSGLSNPLRRHHQTSRASAPTSVAPSSPANSSFVGSNLAISNQLSNTSLIASDSIVANSLVSDSIVSDSIVANSRDVQRSIRPHPPTPSLMWGEGEQE